VKIEKLSLQAVWAEQELIEQNQVFGDFGNHGNTGN